MYPESLKRYVKENGVPRKLSRVKQFTAPFLQFIEFCSGVGYDLLASDLIKTQSCDIRTAILNDLPAPKCQCGAVTSLRKDVKNNWYATYCSIKCRSNDPAFGNKISVTKSLLYADEQWKRQTEFKKETTMLSRYGVRSPMQNPHLHLKQQASCFQSDENGLRGYESQGLDFLRNRYENIVNGTIYLKNSGLTIEWLDDNGVSRRSYPDFFVDSINSFIEIKSRYTRRKGNNKLIKCKDRLSEMGIGYVIITIEPNKRITGKKTNIFEIETFNLEYIE